MKVYFLIGEPSGDALGAPLLEALKALDDKVEAVGLAGDGLRALGVASLFDIEDIAVMGLAPVVKRLPTIIRRVYATVDDVLQQAPDVLVAIDSPDFTHAVAKRVRTKRPALPIVNYVCPSVWAWRSGRAAAMSRYIDHVLTLLPFEPGELARLGGPKATYVGHPLAELAGGSEKTEHATRLLVLPGSRRSEQDRLLPVFAATLDVLRRRNVAFDACMYAPERSLDRLRSIVEGWDVPIEVEPSLPRGASYAGARAALAASGTVALELAMRDVPMVLAYKTDAAMRAVSRYVTTWSTALPNLIADRVIVPENIDAFAKPERLARQVEELLADGPVRTAQLAGLETVRGNVATDEPASEVAARIVRAYATGQREPIST